MRVISLITVLGAALIPAASARPANCRPQRPTTTSGVSTSITTSVVGAETSSTDAASTTLTTSSEVSNVIETTETESSTATSDMTRAVSESGSVTTAVETTITGSASDTTALITTATTTTETSPTEVSTTEATSPDQTSSAATTTIATTTFGTTIADTTTGEQTTVQTTTAETAATAGTTSAETTTTKQTTGLATTSETTTAAESITTTEIPTTTTATPEPTKALQNGGFEDVTDSAWTFQSGEITTDPNLARSGSNFAKIDIRNEQAGGQQHIEQITSTSNTKQYTLSFYATFLSTPNMKLGSGCYVYALQDSSSINAPTFYLNVDTLNSYQHFTYTFTPYNNNFLLSLRVRCSRGMATTFSVAIDDVSIVEAV